jgi:hypothetical protein
MPFAIKRSGGHSDTSEDGRWKVQIWGAWEETPAAYAEVTLIDSAAQGDKKDHPFLYLLMPCPHFGARLPGTDVAFGPEQITIDLAAQLPIRMTVNTQAQTVEMRRIEDNSPLPQTPVLLSVVGIASLIVGAALGWAVAVFRAKKQRQNNGRRCNA